MLTLWIIKSIRFRNRVQDFLMWGFWGHGCVHPPHTQWHPYCVNVCVVCTSLGRESTAFIQISDFSLPSEIENHCPRKLNQGIFTLVRSYYWCCLLSPIHFLLSCLECLYRSLNLFFLLPTPL